MNIPRHQEALRSSEFGSDIVQLCGLFNEGAVGAKVEVKRQSRKIQKGEKGRKRGRKEVDVGLNSSDIKLELSAEGKTKESLV